MSPLEAATRYGVTVDALGAAAANARASELEHGQVSPQACMWRSVAYRCEAELQRCERSLEAHSRKGRAR